MNKQPPPLHADHDLTAELTWSDRLRVGHPKIDAMHLEFVELANSFLHCTAASACEYLREIELHLQEHFDNEKALMERTDFPATECHLEEHDKVFDTVVRVRQLHSQGEVTLNDVHRLAKALTDWFPGHIFYMDSALATWISKKEHQGSPLVFHRNTSEFSTSSEYEAKSLPADHGER